MRLSIDLHVLEITCTKITLMGISSFISYILCVKNLNWMTIDIVNAYVRTGIPFQLNFKRVYLYILSVFIYFECIYLQVCLTHLLQQGNVLWAGQCTTKMNHKSIVAWPYLICAISCYCFSGVTKVRIAWWSLNLTVWFFPACLIWIGATLQTRSWNFTPFKQ